jgi:outer membrane protein OmpA-like peptidoglycan-associated protein
MRRFIFAVAVFAISVSACSHAQPSSTATPLASPAALATTPLPEASSSPSEASGAASEASASPETSASPEPSATITATPNPNLLEQSNGTIVRAYPTGVSDPASIADNGFDPIQDTSPRSATFELPGVASIAYFQANLPVPLPSVSPETLDIAVSTTSATSGFQDIGTMRTKEDGSPQRLVAGVKARWVRVTSQSGVEGPTFQRLVAQGAFESRPAAAPIAGIYEQYAKVYDGGAYVPKVNDTDRFFRVVTTPDGSTNGMFCRAGVSFESYPGSFDGRYWRWNNPRDVDNGILVANDEGDRIVGDGMLLGRVPSGPDYCSPRASGKGRTGVLILDYGGDTPFYPAENPIDFRAYRFTRISDAMMEPQMLDRASIAVLNRVCSDSDLDLAQGRALMQWVAAGHKLIIEDADNCTKTSYALVPYAFKTSNPGAQGTRGKHLIIVEDDSLGSADPADSHYFVDTKAYLAGHNDLGDANTTTSSDPHWCGHLFGTNLLNVNGFMQMYAQYQNGVIIYTGLDKDDSDNPQYDRLEHLQMELPVGVTLPCSQKISLSFLVEPATTANYVPGRLSTPRFSMEVLANQGWSGSLTIKAVGDLAASVSPSSATMQGGSQPLTVTVTIPKNAHAVPHVIDVVATTASGTTADATITLEPKEIIAKKFTRIRVYGIHFDVDSAVIQPRSESVIAQIAAILRENPHLRLRIEGHTDSDGGAAHNLVLSQHRAQSVVDDLVHRYGIARSRLEPAGFGLTRPVKPNTTKANKALNRRVELVAL